MFGRSKSARFSIVTSSTPGPGEYDVANTMTTKRGTFRPVSDRQSMIPENGASALKALIDACCASPRPEHEASLKKIGSSWTKNFGTLKAPTSREEVATLGSKVLLRSRVRLCWESSRVRLCWELEEP
jgi:hypothetical protein